MRRFRSGESKVFVGCRESYGTRPNRRSEAEPFRSPSSSTKKFTRDVHWHPGEVRMHKATA
jgi:hypothetical protein